MNNKPPRDYTSHQYIADSVLHCIEVIDPFCILAGGAPRDWALGRKPNDLDFYIHVPTHWQSGVFKEALEKALSVTVTPVVSTLSDTYKDREDMYKGMEHLHSLFECEIEGIKCQFMRMNTPTFRSVVPCMGSSVCMVWYKGGLIRFSEEFKQSHKHKVLAVRDNYTAKVAHVNKMKEYFPDYKVVTFKDFNKVFM